MIIKKIIAEASLKRSFEKAKKKAKMIYEKGLSLYKENDYERALNNVLDAIHIGESNKLIHSDLAKYCHKLGDIYDRLNDLERSIFYLNKATTYYETFNKNSEAQVKAYKKKADVYSKSKDWKSAYLEYKILVDIFLERSTRESKTKSNVIDIFSIKSMTQLTNAKMNRSEFASSLLLMAKAAVELDELDQVSICCDQILQIEIWDTTTRLTPANRKYSNDELLWGGPMTSLSADAYELKSTLLKKSGNSDEALAFQLKCNEIRHVS
jgi:tetratricopeptide (TPR) repeat protein